MQKLILTITTLVFIAVCFSLPIAAKEVELIKVSPDGIKDVERVAPKVPDQNPTGTKPTGIVVYEQICLPLSLRHIPLGLIKLNLTSLLQKPSVRTESNDVLIENAPIVTLTDKARQVIDIAPDWIKEDLYFAFPRLGNKQDSYADLIINTTDNRYIDELAFMIAHTSDVEIKRMSNPQIFTENVKWIYENAKILKYVQLVDVGIPGVDANYYTTTKYIYRENGEVKEYTLPMEAYYWHVVHPKINNGNIRMDNENDPQQSTYGYWWRQYMPYNPSTEYDYKIHKVLQEPEKFDIDHFNSLSLPATGHITGWQYEPIQVLKDADTGQPVFIEQKDYNGAFTGCYMVTTLPVEKLYANGESDFLVNMLKRGYFNTPMPLLPVPGIKVVVLQDVNPFGTTAIVDLLKSWNYNVKIYGSESIGDPKVVISRPAPIKIIIASGQPRAFYEKLSQNKDWLSTWLQNANCLEFHAAIDPTQGDWKGLEMPLGVTFDDPENTVKQYEFGYYAVLEDVIKPADYLWDGAPFDHEAEWKEWYGNPFDNSDFAIKSVGKWVAQNMQALVTGTDIERSIQPNQITMLKIGMCGEMQDMCQSAFRSALIPIGASNDYAEDHVWNQLYFLDDWTFFEVWRGGMVSALGKPAGVYDKEYGGKYDISGVWQWRGDGYIIDDTQRYTPTSTFYAKVVDNKGYPIDGARVEVWTDYVWGGYIQAVWSYTDENGECSFAVGDNRKYYGKVVTGTTGTYPQGNNIELVVNSTVADETYKWETPVINTTIQQLKVDNLPDPENPKGIYKLDISYNIPYQILNSKNEEDGNIFTEKLEGGIIDFFICDEENFSNFKNGFLFDAYQLNLRSSSSQGQIEFPTDAGKDYYVVFSNKSKMVLKEMVSTTIKVFEKNQGNWSEIQTTDRSYLIPEGDFWSFKLQNIGKPKILMAGFNPQDISNSSGGTLEIWADLMGNANKLKIYYNGIPTGLEFDAVDDLNVFELNLGAGLPIGSHKIELVAENENGTISKLWPYLGISGEKSAYSRFYDYRENENNLMLFNPVEAPSIIMAGFGNTEISTSNGGYLEINAKVDDPQGLDNIESVNLYLQGGIPTGISLSDNGDGMFSFQSLITSSIPSGNYVIELVAIDKQGNRSMSFPYLTIY
jgi:hypothetical protein